MDSGAMDAVSSQGLLDRSNDPCGIGRRGLRYLMNPDNGDCKWAALPDDKWPDAVDCTDMSDDEFVAELLFTGCPVYTEEHLATAALDAPQVPARLAGQEGAG